MQDKSQVQTVAVSLTNGINSTFYHASFLFQQIKPENPHSRIPPQLIKDPRFNGPN